MPWSMVTREIDTAEFLREENGPLTSPRIDEMDERSAAQARNAHKIIRSLIKAGMVGEGKVSISASGHAHHDPLKMPTDPASADYIAISIGRVR